MPSDPRPADLTAQGPLTEAEYDAVWDAWHAGDGPSASNTDQLLAIVARVLAAVPRLAAPSRGQGAGPCRCGGTKVVTCFVDADVTGTTPCPACSPAPVASPDDLSAAERRYKIGDREVLVKFQELCGPEKEWVAGIVGHGPAGYGDSAEAALADALVGYANDGDAQRAPPAGPETGWRAENELPRPTTLEQAIAERNGWANTACQNQINADYWRDRCTAAESALSAATERAETAERDAGHWKEFGESREQETDAWWEMVRKFEAAAVAAESRCAAALKLAGEAIEALVPVTVSYPRLKPGHDALVARLASLSSPSAPESGTQGVKDG